MHTSEAVLGEKKQVGQAEFPDCSHRGAHAASAQMDLAMEQENVPTCLSWLRAERLRL